MSRISAHWIGTAGWEGEARVARSSTGTAAVRGGRAERLARARVVRREVDGFILGV